jgi:Bacteriophage tail assembly protein
MSVSEWADKFRVIDRRISPEPGPWRTSRVPYTREPMDAFTDPTIERITLVWGTQSGKTSVIENCLAYAITEDPAPMLAVYPSDELAKHISKNRFEPILESTEKIAAKWDRRRSKELEIQFSDMYFALSGSNSPGNLASRPIRYLAMDETDKFPSASGIEANPIQLAEERTKNFLDRKILLTSTPTVKWKHIWRELEGADILKRFYVPCPRCGHYQTLRFSSEGNKKGGIRWEGGSDADPKQVRETAWYSCEACDGVIQNHEKHWMLAAGEWRNEKEAPLYLARSIAFHLNSIYSPWVTFGDMAFKFLTTFKEPEKFQNFINSWLAEPWENKSVTMKSDIILERQADHCFGEVPDGAVFLTMGVDVQLDHFYWSVRAWGEKITSWGVAHGRCDTWSELEDLMRQVWTSRTGGQYIIYKVCIDSGYRTDEVYDFCTSNPIAIPTKGASHPMTSPYSIARIDKNLGKYMGLQLIIHDSNFWKDFISGRMRKENGPGSWMVYQSDDENIPFLRIYANQICSEQKVRKKNSKGAVVEVWEKIGSHADNHYLDTEVNAALAAELLGIRWYRSEPAPTAPTKNEPTQKNSNWASGGKGWIG